MSAALLPRFNPFANATPQYVDALIFARALMSYQGAKLTPRARCDLARAIDHCDAIMRAASARDSFDPVSAARLIAAA